MKMSFRTYMNSVLDKGSSASEFIKFVQSDPSFPESSDRQVIANYLRSRETGERMAIVAEVFLSAYERECQDTYEREIEGRVSRRFDA